MVKASLRAMDTITEFMKVKLPELNTQLDYYAVAGASKRGWTTWDVGAVDPKRVMAIVPVVLDAINFVAVEHHQFRSYGTSQPYTISFVCFCSGVLTQSDLCLLFL
jgi:PhoPQ-activated pathogenicity-related protein